MTSTKKIDEALLHIKEAEKSLKTSLLKWKPDYDIAADEYNKAATCFKTAKQFVQCRDCLLKAAENYKYCRSLFSAAKCIEQAANISKELGEIDQIAALSERAACLFREHGIVDTAALTLEKGAKMIDAQEPEKAVHLYKFAIDIVATESKYNQAADFQSKISRSLVRRQKYDDAADSVRRQISYHLSAEDTRAIGRLAVVLVLIQFARGDSVAAEKSFREYGGYCEHDEVRTVETLLQAFDEEDGDLAKKALNSPFIKHMDVEYSKLARDLPIPKTSEETKKTSQAASGNNDSGATAAADDDEELNLC